MRPLLTAEDREKLREAILSLQRIIRSGANEDDIRSLLKDEIGDANAVSDMQVLAAFVTDTWE